MAVQPVQDPPPQSSLVTLGPTPNVLIGYLLRQSIQNFATAESINSTALKNCVWQPETRSSTTPSTSPADQANTNILITTYTKFDPAKLGMRPSIIIKANNLDLAPQLSIGDATHGRHTLLGAEGIDANKTAFIADEEREYMIRGSFTWYCVAPSGAMAEELGIEVFNNILGWQYKILEDTGLLHFRVLGKGTVFSLKESKQHFVTPINAAFAYTQRYITRSAGPLLKGVYYQASQ